jgi:hypothetical protein
VPRVALIVAALGHFVLLLTVGTKQILSVATSDPNGRLNATRATTEPTGSTDSAGIDPLFDRLTKTYLHLAGIESGYGFFAPNIPFGYRLTLELSDEQEVLQTGVLSPERGETGLRLASFLDGLGSDSYREIRDPLFKLVAISLFNANPAATRVRATVETIILPTPDQFLAGMRRHNEIAYAYEFSRERSGLDAR